MKRSRVAIFLAAGLAVGTVVIGRAAERVELVWPTPNPAWADGKPVGDYLQHAGSGDPESGAFGGVRSGGTHFHEGLDLKCLARDRRGEPLDSVFAVMTGVVRHISASAGDSNYGRYIVLEHPDTPPGVYTLYAHLARIAPGLRAGDRVLRGQAIGTMGHSSGSYLIPTDRAHLHFELGVMVTRDFQAWYERKKFGSRNDHGPWNGMNLMGADPLKLFQDWRARRVNTVLDYFVAMETAVRLRLATHRVPDFVTRYPALLTKPLPLGGVAGWEIRCNWTGLPFAWTPLTAGEVIGLAPEQPLIIEVNAEVARRERSRTLAVSRRGSWSVGKDLETVLQQLFGGR
ncbi:MAG: M23 family metallopeptidase [Opitutus sp.]|nr:M23 family metallopeptidase [Opitutus sp.]